MLFCIGQGFSQPEKKGRLIIGIGRCSPDVIYPDTAAILKAKCKTADTLAILNKYKYLYAPDTVAILAKYCRQQPADTNKILAMYCDTATIPVDTVKKDTLFRGEYLNGFKNIVGNKILEDALIHDLKVWKVNATYAYDLHNILGTSKEPALAKLNARLKREVGIKEVGAARGNSSSCTGAATTFNKAYPDSCDFDSWNLEFEAYNAKPKIGGGYTFDSNEASGPSNEASRALAWADNLRYLQEMKAGKAAGQVDHSVQYWGWYKTPFVTAAPKAIVELTDYAIVHDYEKVPSFSYTASRCDELNIQAGIRGGITIVRPLFSTEPDFMQAWIKAGHTLDEAFYIWYAGFLAKKYKNLKSDGYIDFALDYRRVAEPTYPVPMARMVNGELVEMLPDFADIDFTNETLPSHKEMAKER